jgi:hypothetical protein
MRRAIEFEIRLAYHDRILKTLPEVMQTPDAYTIPDQAPGPAHEYDDPGNFESTLFHIFCFDDKSQQRHTTTQPKRFSISFVDVQR